MCYLRFDLSVLYCKILFQFILRVPFNWILKVRFSKPIMYKIKVQLQVWKDKILTTTINQKI